MSSPRWIRGPLGRTLLAGLIAFSATLLVARTSPAKPFGPGTGSAAAYLGSTVAASCQARSPAHTVALLELFTSEGCSSCPPAERWLAGLPQRGHGFERVVPLAFHIDYWDAIGWKDPYAQARFSERQRGYARAGGSRSVYTPQLMLGGAELPTWSDGALSRPLAAIAGRPARANIEIDAAAVGQVMRLRVSASIAGSRTAPIPVAPAGEAETRLHLAIFEMGLQSAVTRGENSGQVLTHDFVVRQWIGPTALLRDRASIDERLVLDSTTTPQARRRLGVAAFVQRGSGEVVQASACLLE